MPARKNKTVLNLLESGGECSCGRKAYRHSKRKRSLADIGSRNVSQFLEVHYTMFCCSTCKKHFTTPMAHIARKSTHYTHAVREVGVWLLTKQKMTLKEASVEMKNRYGVSVGPSTLHDWLVETKWNHLGV